MPAARQHREHDLLHQLRRRKRHHVLQNRNLLRSLLTRDHIAHANVWSDRFREAADVKDVAEPVEGGKACAVIRRELGEDVVLDDRETVLFGDQKRIVRHLGRCRRACRIVKRRVGDEGARPRRGGQLIQRGDLRSGCRARYADRPDPRARSIART